MTPIEIAQTIHDLVVEIVTSATAYKPIDLLKPKVRRAVVAALSPRIDVLIDLPPEQEIWDDLTRPIIIDGVLFIIGLTAKRKQRAEAELQGDDVKPTRRKELERRIKELSLTPKRTISRGPAVPRP
jgi:hypothetical protein